MPPRHDPTEKAGRSPDLEGHPRAPSSQTAHILLRSEHMVRAPRDGAGPGRSGPGFLLALSLACGPACGPGQPPPSADFEVELGGGSWRFEPLRDGQDVELVRGAQGGWHVWVSVRARGLPEPGIARLLIESEVQDLDGVPPSITEARVRFDPVPNDPERRELVGWVHVQVAPACVVDHPIRLRVVVDAEEDGGTAIDERVVVPRSDPRTRPPGTCVYE